MNIMRIIKKSAIVLSMIIATCLICCGCGIFMGAKGSDTDDSEQTTVDDTAEENKPLSPFEFSFEMTVDGRGYRLSKVTGNREKTVCIPADRDGLPIMEIGANAFERCNEITDIELPNSIEYIGSDAFIGCPRLVAIHFDGDIFDWNKIFHASQTLANIKELYLREKLLTGKLSIFDNETICENAFAGYCSISEIEASGAGVVINENAFSSCNGLTKVVLSGDIEVCGKAFASCNSLESVCIYGTAPDIANNAFANDLVLSAKLDFS